MKLHKQYRFDPDDKFDRKFGIKEEDNPFLSKAILQLRLNRPYVSDTQEYTIMINEESSVIQLWIRTIGCSFSKIGSCSVCDYWIGNRLDHPDEVVKKALSPYKGRFSTLIFNTCGSPFDYNELSLEEQENIWRVIEKIGFQIVIVETHMNTVDECRLNLIKSIINAHIVIEIGLESSNPQVLKYSLNKKVSIKKLKDVIKLVHKYDMMCCTNILLGVPFLSVFSRVNDCICSVKDVLEAGTDTCVVFPINLKEYTLVSLLAKNEMYEPVNGWELISVLCSFTAKELEHINIAWYEEREQNNSSYEDPIIPPSFCPECKNTAYLMLSNYSVAANGECRKTILNQLSLLDCKCKRDYMKRFNNDLIIDNNSNLDYYYSRIKSLMNEEN